MFLIEYKKGLFVNAESIDIVKYTSNGDVAFYIASSGNDWFVVDANLTEKFLNHLQGLNSNIDNICIAHHKMVFGS